MYAAMVVLGAISYLIYYKLVPVRREGIDRVSDNRLVLVFILGFLSLGVWAFILNSLFHSIEEGRIVVGGITWLGGVIGCIPSVYLLIHYLVPREKGNAVNRFSTMMPGLVLAHGFGRLGCFFGGCCYGARTDGPLGVVFPAGSAAGKQYPNTAVEAVVREITHANGTVEKIELYPSLPVLPTQLIEALFAFLLFLVMLIFYKRLKHINVEIYCFAYGTFRFILEFWRGDDRGTTGFALSPSQLMSIIIIIGATLLILYKRKIIFTSLYKKCELWRAEAASAPEKSPSWLPGRESPADTIRKLHSLMKDGIITKEEFEEKKKELLKKI